MSVPNLPPHTHIYRVMDQKSDQREQKTYSFSELAWFSFRISTRSTTLLIHCPRYIFPHPFCLAETSIAAPEKWEFIGWKNFNSDESRLSKSSDKFSPISDPMTQANWLLPRKVRKWEGKIIRHFFVTGCWNYGVLYSRAYNTHISYLIYFHDKKKECWVIVINLLNSPL